MESRQIVIELPWELEEKVKKLANQTHRTISSFITEALERYIAELEDYYTGIEILSKIEKGEEKVHDWEKVKEELRIRD